MVVMGSILRGTVLSMLEIISNLVTPSLNLLSLTSFISSGSIFEKSVSLSLAEMSDLAGDYFFEFDLRGDSSY